MATAPSPAAPALADYRAAARAGDVVADDPAWSVLFDEFAAGGAGVARERAARHAADIGTGFRIVGEADERPWPVSPVPLLLAADEWRLIERGVVQRARLLEALVADVYGPARLVADGALPAALVSGSPFFLRPMTGLAPPGGQHLRFVAFDLGRAPDGTWRVLSDHLRAPVGAGYALENRLATGRTLGRLHARLHIERHAPFFAAFRDGLAAACRRAEPRIGLLTPGRYSASYAEQAHLARYLGFLLVEGDDLAVLDNQLYLRTIGGLKRVDALWRRVDPRMLDPLAFDAKSWIGVAGLVDAYAADTLVVANAPGAGVAEAPALAALLPRLAERLTGEPLLLPGVDTLWGGLADDAAAIRARLDDLVVAPAFGVATLGLAGTAPVAGHALDGEARADLLADLARRPQDYVGRAALALSTMPAAIGDALEPRPFTLRVFAAVDAAGGWRVLPGGLARIGERGEPHAALLGDGIWSADVCVHGPEPVAPVSLLPSPDSLHIRRNPGTLPARVADNFFWLGRYLERGQATLSVVRVLLGTSLDAAGGALPADTLRRLAAMLVDAGAAPPPADLARADLAGLAEAALAAPGGQSIAELNARARALGEGARDRLSADMIRLLEAPFPDKGGPLDRAGSLQRRFAAIAGLAAEHQVRTAAWRFLDLGRRVERAMAVARWVGRLGLAGASLEDLSTLLDLADSQISYRQRYLTGIARAAVVDLVALDPGNPRALAFQTCRIAEHLDALPVLADDGMAEAQQREAAALAALVAGADARSLDAELLADVSRRLADLSDAIGRRYFLQGAEPLRATGLTLA